MAIYDPPDGSRDPRPRCTGHCCRGFSLERPYAEVQAEHARAQNDPSYQSSIPDIHVLAPMLIPLGVYRRQELFTCKHLSKEGNCTIYDTRPQMCRDFPGPDPCKYRNCASHGPQSPLKKIVNWLRD